MYQLDLVCAGAGVNHACYVANEIPVLVGRVLRILILPCVRRNMVRKEPVSSRGRDGIRHANLQARW